MRLNITKILTIIINFIKSTKMGIGDWGLGIGEWGLGSPLYIIFFLYE